MLFLSSRADEGLRSAWGPHRKRKGRHLAIFILIGLSMPMETRSTPPNGENAASSLISPAEARKKASKGFAATPWTNGIKRPVPKHELRAGHPLLVQRIDLHNCFYYLVPFKAKLKTVAVVIIDAATGRFKECAKMRPPGTYPKVGATRAEKILKEHLRARALEFPSPDSPPALVWRPCRQTQSPYEPLWSIRINASPWFVDQGGKVHQRIETLQLKGAGTDP